MELYRFSLKKLAIIVVALLSLSILALAAKAQAEPLYSNVLVSDANSIGNSLTFPNTSRKIAVASDGTIYVVWHGNNGVRIAKSTNRGMSFEPSVLVRSGNYEAEVAVSSTGNVFVAWIEGSSARVSKSTDGGQTFSAPVNAGTASLSVHMAVDGDYVYLIDRPGSRFYYSSNAGQSFTLKTFPESYVFSDVHVNPLTREVIVQKDNPSIVYYVSKDHGETFGPRISPIASINYSVGAISAGPNGNYLFVSGMVTQATRIDLSNGTARNLSFGNTTFSQGRSLSADGFGNIVTGFLDGSRLKYAVSQDLGMTFDTTRQVATGGMASAAINSTNGDVMFVYESSGRIYLSVFANELIGYNPVLSTTSVVFDALEVGETSEAKQVVMTNTSSAPLQITSIQTSDGFAVTNGCESELGANQSCTLNIVFSPSQASVTSGTVEILTNAAPTPRVIHLTGTGVDTTAPFTTATVNGSQGHNDRYVDDVTLTLTSEDVFFGTDGIDRTEYSLDGGATWVPYTAPVVISQEGFTAITYRSIDLAGNIEESQEVSFILDKTAPENQINVTGTLGDGSWYISDISVDIASSDNLGGSIVTEYQLNNGDWQTYTTPIVITDDGIYQLSVRSTDEAGLTSEIETITINLDQNVPTATVNYSTTAPTNGDVAVTITPSEAVTILNNDGSDTITFSDNGSFTFEFMDAAGNTGSVTATVNNIDKEAPTATVSYSTTELTNDDVVATVTPSEEVTFLNNDGSNTITFSENGEFTFEFADVAGNTGSVSATVNNIDKVAPTAIVNYSTTAPTNGDVIATITPSEEVTILNNDGSNTITFSENGSFTFEFADAAGNTGSATVTVNNIDNVAPMLIVTVDKPVINSKNHKMEDIQVTLDYSGTGSDVVSIELTSIISSEAENAKGSGNTQPDFLGAEFGTQDTSFQLRAERSGNGGGRTYTIIYTITDAAGNVSTAQATVVVPHDNSNKKK